MKIFISTNASTFSLYKKFVKDHDLARILHEPNAPCEYMTRIVEDLNMFLHDHDIDSEIVVGRGFKAKNHIIDGCLMRNYKCLSDSPDYETLFHGVVKVGGMVLDPCWQRLGSHYFKVDNYPFADFKKHWHEVVSPREIPEFKSPEILFW